MSDTPHYWTDHLPSKRSMVGLTLLLLAVVSPLLIYNHWILIGSALGFAIGCIMTTTIIRELLDQMEHMEIFSVKLYYWLPMSNPQTGRFGRSGYITLSRSMPSNRWLERWVTWLLALGFFAAPIIIGWAFYAQFKHFANVTQLDPENIKATIEQFSSQNIGESALLAKFPPWLQEKIVDTINVVAQLTVGQFMGLLANYGKWLIAIFIISTGIQLKTYKKEVAYLSYVVERTIPNPEVQANILCWGRYFKETLGGFVIGYSKVAFLLTGLFFVAMLILPFNMGLTAIILMALLLGFVTAVPKIGGFIGLGIAGLYMLSSPGDGFGWAWIGLDDLFSLSAFVTSFGWMIGSYAIGSNFDHILRIVIFIAAAKGMGLFEAYRFTPIIIGESLGVTKMTVILTVVMYVSLDGIKGLTWGVVLLCGHLASLRLDNAGCAPGLHDWKHGKQGKTEDIKPSVSLTS